MLAKLNPDGSFGPKTHSRVVEFQSQKNLARDGVVGPITWEALAAFIEALKKAVDQVTPAADETAQRQRIVDVASSALQTFGWGGVLPEPDGSPRIAAARGYGPVLAGYRARQGGPALATIYTMAGVNATLCLNIKSTMETVYQQDGKKHPDRRTRINQEDIGSWCGIFATYCYRLSGLNVTWNDVKTQNKDKFDKVFPGAKVLKGDIGVMDPMTNHHFVVREDAEPGKPVYSIDGNVGNPLAHQVCPWNSVISERTYGRSTLTGKNGLFLRPKFGAMGK